LTELVVPVLPPDKAAEPLTPMAAYAARRRPDELPADRWLRVHVRAGGLIERVAPFAMTVAADLPTWRRWTGLPFDRTARSRCPAGWCRSWSTPAPAPTSSRTSGSGTAAALTGPLAGDRLRDLVEGPCRQQSPAHRGSVSRYC
jgi:hypothetical protein